MAKINIYIPNNLKARMDAVDDIANWSDIAQLAFKNALKCLELMKEYDTDRARIDKEMVDSEARLAKAKDNKQAQAIIQQSRVMALANTTRESMMDPKIAKLDIPKGKRTKRGL